MAKLHCPISKLPFPSSRSSTQSISKSMALSCILTAAKCCPCAVLVWAPGLRRLHDQMPQQRPVLRVRHRWRGASICCRSTHAGRHRPIDQESRTAPTAAAATWHTTPLPSTGTRAPTRRAAAPSPAAPSSARRRRSEITSGMRNAWPVDESARARRGGGRARIWVTM
jgi:hypothetical protein